MDRQIFGYVVLVFLAGLLHGCGQKGDLYLPVDDMTKVDQTEVVGNEEVGKKKKADSSTYPDQSKPGE